MSITKQPAECAIAGCANPGVVTVSRTANRIAFRTDHAQMPAWADWLRCWPHASAELDQHITATTALEAHR